MEIDNLLTISDRDALRSWLHDNNGVEKYCWVIVSIKPEPGRIQYLDAVEEALCFGWIDGVKKKISDTELAQRLSPRSVKSNWTELNKERVRRLEKLGLMTDAGRQILPDMAVESFEINPIIEQRLKTDTQIYEIFMSFPELYKRVRIDTIQCNIKQVDLFERRLNKFIENTKKNKLYGTWHDEGRPLEY